MKTVPPNHRPSGFDTARCPTRTGALAFLTLLAFVALVLPVTSHAAGSPNIVISQIYGGGGNAGATYKNDFVELFNRGSGTVSITGWSIQYASATGTSWTKVSLSGSIPAGGYYLIQLQGGANGIALPTPDLSSTSISMSPSAGKLALVNNNTTITSGTSCPTGATIVDFVGYGAADCKEGSAAASGAPNNTSSILRKNGGCTDTDANNADFDLTGSITPRNSSSPLNPCLPPGIAVQPASQSIECTDPVTFTVTATGTPTLSYQWQQDGFDILGANSGSYSIPSVSFADAGSYTVFIVNAFGSILSDPAALTVIDTTPPLVACKNISVNLTGPTVSITPTQVLQSMSDTCGTPSVVSVVPDTFTCLNLGPNAVTLTITDGNGNNATCTATVTVVDARPPLTVTYVDDNYAGIPNGTLVQFPFGAGPLNHVVGCDAFPTIQAGIDAVVSGGLVNVAAGAYVENVVVNKSLELAGAGQGISTIVPALSSPACAGGSLCAGHSSIILVQASDVTIHGFTLDGDNPALTSGEMHGGADVDARNGIITDHTIGLFNNLEVHHVTAKNIYLRGIYASSGGTFNFHDNIVQNVQGDVASVAMFNFGGSGIFQNNSVSDANDAIAANHSTGTKFLNNTVSSSGSGVHTDNAGDGGGTPDLLQGNSVASGTAGSYGVWTFVPYIAPTVDGNVINGCTVGLAAFGQGSPVATLFSNNDVDGNSAAGTFGAIVSTSIAPFGSTDVSAAFLNNHLLRSETGVSIESEPTFNAGAVLTGNSAREGAVGVVASGSLTKALLEGNDLTLNTMAALRVSGGAIVDAGDCSGGNVTGLGSSAGGNTFTGYGFDNAAPWAIENLNSSTDPAVLAQNNDFGAAAGDAIEQLLFDDTDTAVNSAVIFSQSALVVSCPSGVNVQCASLAPAGAATLADFIAQGGAVSGSDATISFSDGPLVPGPLEGTITRTYTIADSCGHSTTCTQIITVDDTLAPFITQCASSRTMIANANCVALLPDLTGEVLATDCNAFTIVQSPPPGTPLSLGATTVTFTVEDATGNFSQCQAVVTVLDQTPPTLQLPGDLIVECTSAAGANVIFVVTATDNCNLNPTVLCSPVSGSTFPIGQTLVNCTADDGHGNSTSGSFTVTVQDTTPPVIHCPPGVIVNCNQPRDPYATGTATATDECGTTTITYDDDRSGLTGCNATGTILRTWTATDEAGLTTSCIQTITVIDTIAPVIANCPASITVFNAPTLCSAPVTFTPPTAKDVCYNQGFEDPAFVSGNYVTTPSTDWNDFNSHLQRVPSGTDGIVSRSGAAHAVIDSTALPSSPDDFTGAFTRLGGYSPVFGTGFRVAQDVYLELSDPAVLANTYGWDLSTAASTPANGYGRDFIFHTASDVGGHILVAGSNNSGFTRRNDLASINHHVVTASGWYTFEWIFRDDGSGVLAVDLNLRDDTGTLLFTETRSDPSDVIATAIGGNRYMWFTFFEVGKLAIDNTVLERNVAVTCDHLSGESFPVGDTLVTCTAIDACNNSAACSFTVSVEDHELPTIICPDDVLANNDAGQCSAVITLATPVTSDNCGVLSVVNDAPASFPVGDTMVTWKVTDLHGNMVTCVQLVTVVDNEAPQVSCPPDVTVQCDSDVPPRDFAGGTVTDNCDPHPAVIHVGDVAVGTCPKVITRTYRASDITGNSVTCTQTITVHDTTPPVLTCPPNLTVQCDGDVPLPDFAGGSVSDNCDPTPLVIHVGDSSSGFNPRVIARTYRATDVCGNFAECTQTITVHDTVPPSITCPPDVVVSSDASLCTASGVSLGTPTTGDNCGVASVVNNAPSIYPFGVTTVTWTVTDVHGLSTTCAQTVTVEDHELPTITCPADVVVVNDPGQCSAVVALGTPVTSDNCGVASVSSNAPASFPVGDTMVTWKVTDLHGNMVTCVQLVTVVDNEAPQVSCPPDVTVQCDGDVPQANFAGGTVTDNCDPLPTVIHVSDVAVGSCPKVITRTYRATDVTGNSITCTQIITVHDTTPPTLTCPPNLTVQCDDDVPTADFTGGSASDNCDPAPLVMFVGDSSAGTNPRIITRTYRATDACGNFADCTQVITVHDIVPPSIICPPNVVVITDAGLCTASGVSLGSPTVGDNCGVAGVANNAPSIYPFGVTTVTWTVTDVHGLSTTCAQTVTVNDREVPHITAQPQSLLRNAGSSATFSVTVTSCGPVTYQWCHGATPLPGETHPTLTLNSVQLSDAGPYTVKISNSAGTTTSDPATLTVNRPPIANDDGLTTRTDQPVVVSHHQLLLNDSDPDLDPLTIVAVTTVSDNGGNVLLGATTITYTPPSGFSGVDRFSYAISDGRGGFAIADVEVFVSDHELPPPNTLSITPTPHGYLLLYAGVPGQPYRIERSVDLIHWSTIHSETAPLYGIISFEDTNPPPNYAFYRVASP